VDARDVLRVCVRRWWVMVPVLALAAGSGVGLSTELKPEYFGFGSYALVFAHSNASHSKQADPRAANPLSGRDGALLGEALLSELTTPQLEGSVGGSNRGWPKGQPDTGLAYRIGVSESSKSFLVETWGDDPSMVAKTVDAVLAEAPLRSKLIQSRAGVQEGSQFTTFVTAPTQVVAVPPQSWVKVLLTLLGIGLIGGATLSVFIDRLIARPKQRTRRSRDRHNLIFGQAATVGPHRPKPRQRASTGQLAGHRDLSAGQLWVYRLGSMSSHGSTASPSTAAPELEGRKPGQSRTFAK
jgi:hypothetical protein